MATKIQKRVSGVNPKDSKCCMSSYSLVYPNLDKLIIMLISSFYLESMAVLLYYGLSMF